MTRQFSVITKYGGGESYEGESAIGYIFKDPKKMIKDLRDIYQLSTGGGKNFWKISSFEFWKKCKKQMKNNFNQNMSNFFDTVKEVFASFLGDKFEGSSYTVDIESIEDVSYFPHGHYDSGIHHLGTLLLEEFSPEEFSHNTSSLYGDENIDALSEIGKWKSNMCGMIQERIEADAYKAPEAVFYSSWDDETGVASDEESVSESESESDG